MANEQPTKEQPYWAGPKTFRTANEAARYANREGYSWIGGPGWMWRLKQWLGQYPKDTQTKILSDSKECGDSNESY